MAKYVFVTGGVTSSLGKGITAASVGRLLKARGLKVSILKLDPYINVDPGTMSPYQHGEVFVTDDGAETDLDLGHYERFIDENLTQGSNVTTGQHLLRGHRQGASRRLPGRHGPGHPAHHQRDQGARSAACRATATRTWCIVEVGGTVGDIESLPFLEAIRQMRKDVGRRRTSCTSTSRCCPLPRGDRGAEDQAHPALGQGAARHRHPARLHRAAGRTAEVPDEIREKIALFTDVDVEAVVPAPDARPRSTRSRSSSRRSGSGAGWCGCWAWATRRPPRTSRAGGRSWSASKRRKPTLEIALVGKYIELPDAYLSVTEALRHAAWANGVDARIRWVDSEALTSENVAGRLAGAAGVLVPGGFGHRGIEGKVLAAHWARDNRLPYLGLCLGLQCAVIEFARDILDTTDVNSTEFDMFTAHPVIDFMPDQRDVEDKGGTMRLGLYPAKLLEGSKARQVYGTEVIYERHRHRFEVNNRYRQTLEQAGMLLSGVSPDSRLVEIVELRDHPWFVASQFHPEFKSRPERPHPLFHGFVATALALRDGTELRLTAVGPGPAADAQVRVDDLPTGAAPAS